MARDWKREFADMAALATALEAERDRYREALESIAEAPDAFGMGLIFSRMARAALSPECDRDHMTLTHGPGARCPSCGVWLTIPSPR